jgi:hypothetical protein
MAILWAWANTGRAQAARLRRGVQPRGGARASCGQQGGRARQGLAQARLVDEVAGAVVVIV